MVSVDGSEVANTGLLEASRKAGLAGVFSVGAWLGDGIVASARKGDTVNLWWFPIDARSFRAEIGARQLTFGAVQESEPALARDGSAVFCVTDSSTDLWAIDLDERTGAARGTPRRLTFDKRVSLTPSLSRDGRSLAYVSYRSATDSSMVLMDLESGKKRNLGKTGYYPTLSADGTRLAYNQRDIYVAHISGGPAEKIADAPGRSNGWLSGKNVILFNGPIGGIAKIASVDVASKSRVVIARHPKFELHGGYISPDDRWFAFHATNSETGRIIYIAPYRGQQEIPEQEWIPVTDGKQLDREARWSADGRFLYFFSDRDGHRCVWGQRLEEGSKRPVGPPFAVFHAHDVRNSITNTGNVTSYAGPAVAKGIIVFGMGARNSNIWLTKLPISLP